LAGPHQSRAGVVWSRRPPYLLLLAVVTAAACRDSPTEPVEIPAILSVTVGARPTALVQSLDVSLDGDAGVEAEYWTAGGPRLRVSSSDAAATHDLSLYRLRAGSTYDFEVTPVASDGTRGTGSTGQFVTDMLPTELAAVQVNTLGTATFPLLMMEVSLPGVTGVPIVIDRDGFVVWYRPGETARTHGLEALPDVGFAINSIDEGVEIVTADNQVLASLAEADAATRTGLGTFDIHHDMARATNHSLLLLVQDTSTVSGTVWNGEAIWEWDWVSDQLVKRWSSFDFMSPATDVGARSWSGDWLHANSLSIGPRGNVVVSFFWTHEVVSIAPGYQSLEWRLGGPASTINVLGGAMEAGQHTVAEIAPNRILLFDNGLDRPGGELFSRASELQINTASNTASIVWEYRTSPDTYAPIVGSARRLQNQNTVVTFGVAPGALSNFPDAGPLGVYEVTPSGATPWSVSFEGIDLLYRAEPLVTLGGEVEVP
jgi:hypothetical protein